MIRWLRALIPGGALLLLSRWLLRVASPRDDLAAVERAWGYVVERGRSAWTIIWRAYGPVTADMRAKWEELRTRYRRGSFGTEGT
jgi:hypothetical protein